MATNGSLSVVPFTTLLFKFCGRSQPIRLIESSLRLMIAARPILVYPDRIIGASIYESSGLRLYNFSSSQVNLF